MLPNDPHHRDREKIKLSADLYHEKDAILLFYLY